MIKLVSTICMLGLASILLTSCSNMPSTSTDSTEIATNKNTNNTVNANQQEVILAEHPNANIQLIGIAQPDSEIYGPITLKIGNDSKTYQWQTINNPEYPPYISIADLNEDGKDEIYVQLIKGYGTNVLDSQLYILSENFNELTSPNPFFDIKNMVKTLVIDNDQSQIYKLTVNNTVYSFTYAPTDAAMWFEDIVFGKMTSYHIEDNRLHVTVSIQVAPTIKVGNLTLSYQYTDKQYKLDRIEYNPPVDAKNAK